MIDPGASAFGGRLPYARFDIHPFRDLAQVGRVSFN
jgi:hypothetical protein